MTTEHKPHSRVITLARAVSGYGEAVVPLDPARVAALDELVSYATGIEEQLETLDAWASRMPDAGFTSDDPRWEWWHQRPRISNPASEPPAPDPRLIVTKNADGAVVSNQERES